MKNKKGLNIVLSALCLALVCIYSWFLIEYIPTFNHQYRELCLSGFIILDILFFGLFIFSIYKIFEKNKQNTVIKSITTSFNIVFLIVGALVLSLGIATIVKYYSIKLEHATSLATALFMITIGLSFLILSFLGMKRNAYIRSREKNLQKYMQPETKVETFNDKKINKTCKYCGCALSQNDEYCPNCKSKVE